MGIPAYKKCPRCELNYIKAEEDLCDVCKAELKLAPNIFVDEEDELEEGVICPICKKNYIGYEDDMCQACRDKLEAQIVEPEEEDEESWRSFLDDDKPVEIPDEEMNLLSLTELEEEESEFVDDEEEVIPLPDVDDDFVSLSDLDEDLDEEDEEDEEEDDRE